ncbi:MAG: hypothetical protein WCT85_01485 [Parachlamydiales bacterium]|jgi:hypothetical protein
MENNPKVLLACPLSIYKDYVIPDWLNFIQTLTYPNYDIFLVDNSHDPSYHKKLRKMGFDVEYVKPEGESRFYMAECDEIIRNKVLYEGYDYLMRIECDVFTPRNIIEVLMNWQTEVISAPYFMNLGPDSKMLYHTINFEKGLFAKARNLTFLESFLKTTGDVELIYGCGIGATLIQADILNKIHFRVEKNNAGFSDSFFYIDLINNGIINYVDTSIVTHHANRQWQAIIDNEKHAGTTIFNRNLKRK